MEDTIIAKRTTPYGVQLEDGSFLNASTAVINFLKDKLPAELEVVDATDNGKLMKVHVVNQLPKESPKFKTPTQMMVQDGKLLLPKELEERNKTISVLTSYAKDLYVLLVNNKITNTEEAKKVANETIWGSYQFFKGKIEGKSDDAND